MAAIPVIAAGVSAIGTLSSISQQNRQANAQAAAIANERTAAIINSEIQQASVQQQDKIARLQNDIALTKNEKDAQLASEAASLQRQQFATQQMGNRIAVEQQRMLNNMMVTAAKETIATEAQVGRSQLVGANAETQAELSQAQSQLGLGEQATQVAGLLRSTRMLSAMGTDSSSGQMGYLENQVSGVQASMQDIANEGNRVNRVTDQQLGLLDQSEQSNLGVVDSQNAEAEAQLADTEDVINNNDRNADLILQEYLANIDVLKNTMLTDTNFSEQLRQQQVRSQERAAKEGLASNMTALSAQESMIQRPGFVDLLQGGFNVFNVYSSLNQQQQALNNRPPVQRQSVNQSQYQNQFYVDPATRYNGNLSGSGSFSSGLTYDLADPMVPIEANVTRGLTIDQMANLTRPVQQSPTRQQTSYDWKAPNWRPPTTTDFRRYQGGR